MHISAAKWTDVQAPTARIECLDMQKFDITARSYIYEHALHALLMKLLMLTVADDILQQ